MQAILPIIAVQQSDLQFAVYMSYCKVLQCSTDDLHCVLCISYHMLLQYSSDVMQLVLAILDSIVTARLKLLPDCRLQNFVRSSLSTNPSQALYIGKGAILARRLYKIIDHCVRVYCCITHFHETLKGWPKQKLLGCFHCSTCFSTSILSEVHHSSPSSGLSILLSRK